LARLKTPLLSFGLIFVLALLLLIFLMISAALSVLERYATGPATARSP
jgi:hypothetical protein